MIQKQLNGEEYLFVGVPEDAYNFRIEKSFLRFAVYYDLSKGSYSAITFLFKDFGGRKKYPSDIQIIGKPLDLSEEQCSGIVPMTICYGSKTYPHYNEQKYDMHDAWSTAKESLLSLLQSLNLQPETTLIVKKL